ncbi:MAG: hypothetical protein QOE52_5075 [Mycobacterium sp.]|jgi:uncharacterized protein YukE|nr:hypothetical protein [Mycobacterium sp.]MDT5345891.1 hypothetical protein [Mycobacterium sp.]MDT7739024.1 hypothetical protein [Mycobacterium sp.]MDT7768817.1 hypothetical protein [Mycobacterium sp.]
MTHMLYNYGAGDALAQAFKAQAQMLHEHADDMQQSGNALVAEYLQGAAGDAFIQTLGIQTSAAKDIADTITRHSGAVTNSFGEMQSTDIAGAHMLGH